MNSPAPRSTSVRQPHSAIDNYAAFFYILLSLLFQLLALIYGKYASLRLSAFTLHGILTNYDYLISLLCLGLQALFWPLALRRFPLFWAYLFMSALYLMIPPVSHYIFHESVSSWNIAGSVIIMLGIVFISTGVREVENDEA